MALSSKVWDVMHAFTLKLEAYGSSETLVPMCYTTWCDTPGDSIVKYV